MPFKTAEAKLKRNREWRKTRTAGYYRWLYARRKLRFDRAARFEGVLRELAASGFDDGWPDYAIKAQEALAEMDRREREVGNEYDHDLDQGVWVE